MVVLPNVCRNFSLEWMDMDYLVMKLDEAQEYADHDLVFRILEHFHQYEDLFPWPHIVHQPAWVNHLIQLGTDVNLIDSEGIHTSFYVIQYNMTEPQLLSLRLLLEAGLDIHALNDQDLNAWEHTYIHNKNALSASFIQATHLLIEHDPLFVRYMNPFALCIQREFRAILPRALELGFHPNDPEYARRFASPLFHIEVIWFEQEHRIARLLLDAGANPNAQSSNHWTPLFVAHSPALCDLLLQYGADPFHQNDQGSTPLMVQLLHPFDTTSRAHRAPRAPIVHHLLSLGGLFIRDHQNRCPARLAHSDLVPALQVEWTEQEWCQQIAHAIWLDRKRTIRRIYPALQRLPFELILLITDFLAGTKRGAYCPLKA